MLKKGQVTIGLLIVVFMMIIVGVALISPVAQNVETVRTTVDIVNSSIISAAIGTAVEMPGSGIVGTVIAVISNGTVLAQDTDYTVLSRQPPITSGVVTNTFNAITSSAASATINVTYTAEPDGFDTSSGGRAVILLVVIFFALAIAAVALIPAARSGVMEMFRG